MMARVQREHRLSHYVDKLLDRILLEPCWYTAVDHSGRAIGGSVQAQMNWRQHQKWMGIKPSQLDWNIEQRAIDIPSDVPLWRIAKIELKYGDNTPDHGQETTMRLLADRQIFTGCCWTIAEFYAALKTAGFQLHANAENIAHEIIERHAAAEREAAIKAAGPKPAKSFKPVQPKPTMDEIRKAEALRRRVMY
jgi:hypothetical protein